MTRRESPVLHQPTRVVRPGRPYLSIFFTWAGLTVSQLAIWFCPVARVSLDCLPVAAGWAVSLLGGLSGLVVLHAAWSAVPEDERRTTPGRAVGFLFIPGFNLFWVFTAVWGLARDVNALLPNRLRHLKINSWLSCVVPLLATMSVVPGLGLYTAIPALAAYSALLVQWHRFAVADTNHKLMLNRAPKQEPATVS